MTYATAALGLLEMGGTAGEVLATTMLGVGLFATLVRDYRNTRRLVLNVLPYIGVVVIMQTLAVWTALDHHQPLLVATIMAAPLLVGNIFMILHRDLVAAHRKLASALVRSEAAAHAKSEFLTTMSHEIRTPLNAVIGFAALLESSPELSDRDASHVQSIRTAGAGLMAVVNDILDASSLEAGAVRLDPHPIDAADFLRVSLGLFEPLAAAKSVALRLELASDLPATLILDDARSRQILSNLIGNALKFTSSGFVTVRATYARNARRLEVEVEDSGVGIPETQLDRLFERFSQLDMSGRRRFGGSGLGLAISKGLAELMGGSITASSTPGVGSIFRLVVPAAIAATFEASTQAPAEAPIPSADVLVIDDLQANRRLIRLMMEAAGHQVTEAASGAEGLELSADRAFDLIFMDLQMPEMDGYATASIIRTSAGPNAATPIVALSADVLPEHVHRCFEAGLDDHLGKPILPGALLGVVARWCGGSRADLRRHPMIDADRRAA